MKYTIEVEDFYLDEDESLEKALKDHIIYTVKNQILEQIQSKVDKEIQDALSENILSSIKENINKMVFENIKSQEIKRYNKKPITVEDYIKECFDDTASSYSHNAIQNSLSNLIENHVKKLKSSYDLYFASQIVLKMNQNGLLKEGMDKILLEDNDKKGE